MSETSSEQVETSPVLLVPRTPGPLVDLESLSKPRRPDDIDEVVTDLFGPDPKTSPGPLDVALLSGGLALLLWAELGLHSTGIAVLGGIIAFLGSILPVRSAWRGVTRWWTRRRRAAVMSGRLALNVGDPVMRRLVDAYNSLLEAAKLPGAPFEAEAVNAALLALTESASLLGGDVPSTAEERAYVEKRTEALHKLTEALRHQHTAWLRAGRAADEAEKGLERTARARAGEELDHIGVSSLNDLGELTRLTKASRDGDT